MDSWLLLRLAVLALALIFAGCQPKIGDECTVSTDCSAVGDRLCATDQPEGYCTIFNCEPGTCPEESICVAFGTRLSRSPDPLCADLQGGSRFQRTFCMARCDDDDDCRSGYACLDMGVKNDWGAIVIESGGSRGKVNGKVCAVPFSGQPVTENAGSQVCTGTDAGFDVEPWTPNVPEAGPTTDGAADAGSDADASSDLDAAPDAPGPDADEGGSDANGAAG